MLSFLQLLRSEKRGDLLWMNLASFRPPLLYGMLSALSIRFLSRNLPTEEIPLAIFWPFGIIDLENKICGSWRKVGAPPACTGDSSTYTTAWGRTAWAPLYSFFRAIASVCSWKPLGNLCLAVPWGAPQTFVRMGICLLACRVGSLEPARHICFSPTSFGERQPFPGRTVGKTQWQESVDFAQKRVDFTKRLCIRKILCYVLSKFNNWFQLE